MSALAAHGLLLLCALAAVVAAALAYLPRYEIERPPVGVYTFPDIVFMAAAVVAVPILYAHLPVAAIGTLFGLVLLVILRYTLQPMLPGRSATALAVATLALDAGLSLAGGTGGAHVAYVATNDLVLAVAVLGVANLYAQSGMRASHVTLFAALLAGYDYVATAALPTTTDLLDRLAGQPFAPQIVIGSGTGLAGVGLGDTLMLVLWAVVARKAFGRPAGLAGAVAGVSSIGLILWGFVAGLVTGAVPAMVLMGPLIVAQYAGWRGRRRVERTTVHWRSGTARTRPDHTAELDDEVLRLLAQLPAHRPPGPAAGGASPADAATLVG